MSNDDFDLSLSAETIQEITVSTDRNLKCPASTEENPTVRFGKSPGLGAWSELVRVRDTDITKVKKDPTNKNKSNFVLVLEVLGPDQGGYSTNAGRPHYQYWYMDKEGLASKEPKTSGIYKRRMHTINSLLGAAGMDLEDGVPSYKAIFTGDDKALIGAQVIAVFRKYWDEREGAPRVDIEGFLAIQGSN